MNHDAAPPSSTEPAADRPALTPVSRPGPAPPPAALQPLAEVALHPLPPRAPPACPVSNEELVNYGSAPPFARPPRAPGRFSIGPLGQPRLLPPLIPRRPTARPDARQTAGMPHPCPPCLTPLASEAANLGGGATKGRSRRQALGSSRLRKRREVGRVVTVNTGLGPAQPHSAVPESCPAPAQRPGPCACPPSGRTAGLGLRRGACRAWPRPPSWILAIVTCC